MTSAATTYVKRTTCRACGAPKVTRPKTGYVYCDYCATLTDWDFEAAKAMAPPPLPEGQDYTSLFARVKTEMDTSLAEQDRDRYFLSQLELYKLYVKYFPSGLSPRVGDPAYCTAFVEYTARTTTAQDFDPDHLAHSTAVTNATRAIQFEVVDGKRHAVSAPFWAMWEAFRSRLRASLDLNAKVGLLAQQPDGAPAELLERMGVSAIVQYWIEHLAAADAERLLVVSGMKGEYVAIVPPPMTLSKCTGCSRELHVAEGAQRVLCEACGTINAATSSTIPCPTCGASVTLAAGSHTASCPYCKTSFHG